MLRWMNIQWNKTTTCVSHNTWAGIYLIWLLFGKTRKDDIINTVQTILKERGKNSDRILPPKNYSYEQEEPYSSDDNLQSVPRNDNKTVFLGCDESCTVCDLRYIKYLLFTQK